MKFDRKIGIIILIGSLVLASFLLTACGNESAPDGSTITFNPASISITGISADTCANIAVTIRYDDGTPMPEAVLTIFGSMAEPRNAGNATPRYQFYAYPNCDLTDPSNPKVNSGFQGQADDHGVYRFSVNIYALVNGAANSFTNSIDAYSGTAFGSAGISIQ